MTDPDIAYSFVNLEGMMKSWDDPQCETPTRPKPEPTRATVAAALQEALDDLGRQRWTLIGLTERCAAAKAQLQVNEDLTLLTGTIDGPNETLRGAQLRRATEEDRTAFQALDLQRAVASIGLEMARDRLKTYRALAIMLAGERDDV